MRRRWYEHTKYEPNPVLIVCIAVGLALLAVVTVVLLAWMLRLF